MKTAKSSHGDRVVDKRRGKAPKANGTPTGGQRMSKRSKIKYKARELAGSLHRYAKGRPNPSRVREFVKQEVACAAAQEG